MSEDANTVATNRLRLFHLVVWVCACAVQAALIRDSISSMASEQYSRPAILFWSISSTMGGGTALAGLLLFAKRRLTKQRFPVEPGEWLWTVLGVDCVYLHFMLRAVYLLFRPELLIAAHYGTKTLVLCLGWSRCRVFGRWGVGLLLIAVPDALATICWLFHWVGIPSFTFPTWFLWLPRPWAVSLIKQFVVVSLAIDDLVHRRQRAWSHWAGVILWLWGIMGLVIGYFSS